jgi:hypothetical protein
MSDRPSGSREVRRTTADPLRDSGTDAAPRDGGAVGRGAGERCLYACGADEDEAARSVAEGATTMPDCVLTPEQEEGPFYIDLAQVRQDIVENRPGVPLALALTSSTRIPASRSAMPPSTSGTATRLASTRASHRRAARRDLPAWDPADRRNGLAEFATIYPGQYPGRTTHIHVKVHIGGRQSDGTYSGGHVSHTGQLFTSDRRDAEVFALAPTTGIRPRSPRATRMASFGIRAARARCSPSHGSAAASRGEALRQE